MLACIHGTENGKFRFSVLEIKGEHLKGNDDSEYKRKIQLTESSIFLSFGQQLRISPNLPRMGRIMPSLPNHPLVEWLQENSRMFKDAVKLVAKLWRNLITHQELTYSQRHKTLADAAFKSLQSNYRLAPGGVATTRQDSAPKTTRLPFLHAGFNGNNGAELCR